jgi:hypothetical protein
MDCCIGAVISIAHADYFVGLIADKIKRTLIEKAKTKKAYYRTLKAEGIEPSSSSSVPPPPPPTTTLHRPDTEHQDVASEEAQSRHDSKRDRKGKRRAVEGDRGDEPTGRRWKGKAEVAREENDVLPPQKRKRVSAEEVEELRRRREEEKKAWGQKAKNGRQPRLASRMDVLLSRIERQSK